MRVLRLLPLPCALLLALYAPAQAQEAEPKPDPKIELMKLYKTAGTSWAYRVVKWEREGMAETQNESFRVEKVEGTRATVTHSGSSFGGAAWSGNHMHLTDTPTGYDLQYADAALPEETLDMGFAKFACKKHVDKDPSEQTTTWVSVEHHPLVVKQVRLAQHSSEVRKLTAFQQTAVDPWLLYRMPGRTWTIRNDVTAAGIEPMTSHTRNTVKSVDAGKATLSIEMLDEDKKGFAGAAPTDYDVQFLSAPAGAAAALVVKTTQETVTVAAGTFECTVIEHAGTKSWMSVLWLGLMVKMTADSVSAELIEFDLGHDTGKFYRTAGNASTTRNTTEIAGMNIATLTKQNVTKVENGQATVLMTSLDQNGREMGRNEFTRPADEKTTPLLKYNGQKEEWVSTPAGSFAAIVTEPAPDQKIWTHHGIVVRTEMRNKDFKVITEVTELKLD